MRSWKFAKPPIGKSFGAAWRRRGAWRRFSLGQSSDLIVAVLLAVASALTASALSAGDPMRAFVTLPILLTVPGYLLIQALLVPAPAAPVRVLHVLLGVGLSPALVGLLAMSTDLLPGGFRPMAIIMAFTGACVVLASIAFVRRSLHAKRIPLQEASTSSG